MNDYDGLHLCEICEDAYTTGTLCTSCARQQMIDNADLSMVYDALYEYDDEDEYSEYQDGYWYDEDETIQLDTTWRWKLYVLRGKLRKWKFNAIHKLRMKFDQKYRQRYDDIPF